MDKQFEQLRNLVLWCLTVTLESLDNNMKSQNEDLISDIYKNWNNFWGDKNVS